MTLLILILIVSIVYLSVKNYQLDRQCRAVLNSYTHLIPSVRANNKNLDALIVFLSKISENMSKQDSNTLIPLICSITRTNYMKDEYGYLVPVSIEETAKVLAELIGARKS